jgi:hypothetical protein
VRRLLALSVGALCVTLPLAGATVTAATAATKSAGIISPDSDASTNAAETLLSSIPSGAREACNRREPAQIVKGQFADAITAVQCDNPADGVSTVVYVQFDDAAKMAAQYAALLPTGIPASDGSDPNACAGTDTWNYTDGAAGGDDACFVEGDASDVVWTATTPLILGIAHGSDGTTVKTWWNKSSGPLEKPDTVTNFGTGTKKEYAAADKALLGSHKSVLTKCKDKLAFFGPGDAEWAWYPWLQSAQACDGPQKGSVYLAKLDPASAKAFEAYYVNITLVGDGKSSVPKGCEDQDLLDAKKKVVGTLSCVLVGKVLYATWYATDTGVVGAANVAGSPAKTFAYLNKYKLL